MPTKNPELRAIHNRRYYEKNKPRVRERNRLHKIKSYEFVNNLKKNPCHDCKQTFDPICMDFDHLPEFEKVANVSELINRGASLIRLQKEIDKCDLVCANCHRIRSRDRRAPKV
jgi:hypothetical protein